MLSKEAIAELLADHVPLTGEYAGQEDTQCASAGCRTFFSVQLSEDEMTELVAAHQAAVVWALIEEQTKVQRDMRIEPLPGGGFESVWYRRRVLEWEREA